MVKKLLLILPLLAFCLPAQVQLQNARLSNFQVTATGGGGDVVLGGLLAWWKLDETSGTSAVDSSGNSKTGTTVNSPAWVAGRWNNCLQFVAASSQQVGCGDIGWSSLSSASLSLWFKRSGAGALIAVGADSGTDRFQTLVFSDGNVYLSCGNTAAGQYGFFASNDTSWHHLVMIFDGGLSGDANRLKAYLDNSLQSLSFGAGGIPAALGTGLTPLEIGHAAAGYSDGLIDDILPYNRALTPTEVGLLFVNP